jgi:hypothetical protein
LSRLTARKRNAQDGETGRNEKTVPGGPHPQPVEPAESVVRVVEGRAHQE